MFRIEDPSTAKDDWLLELSGGSLVKPTDSVSCGALMDAEVLSESEVKKLLKSGS